MNNTCFFSFQKSGILVLKKAESTMGIDVPLLVTWRIAVLKILDGDTARVVGRRKERTWA